MKSMSVDSRNSSRTSAIAVPPPKKHDADSSTDASSEASTREMY
jgi:hypothetical protein